MPRWRSVLAVIAVIVIVLFVHRCFVLLSLWRRTLTVGHPVPLWRLFRMATRRVPPATIAGAYVRARENGLDLTLDQLEDHYLDGGQPYEVVDRLIAAKRKGLVSSFSDAASAVLRDDDSTHIPRS